MKCDIYIKTNGNPAVQKNAKAKWLICAYDPRGQIMSSRDGVVVAPRSTVKRAALVALRDALKRFGKAAVIRIYITDPFVRNMLTTNMPYRWSRHDWRLFRYDRDIRYVELWQEISELLKNHAVNYAGPEELAANNILSKMEV